MIKEFEIYPKNKDFVFPKLYGWSGVVFTKEVPKKIRETFQYAKDLEDDRLLAIVCALVTETAIDDLGAALMPGYKKLKEKHDFTFSVKTDVLRAHKIIPNSSFSNVDFIRTTRNKFAHNLHFTHLTDLGNDHIKSLKDRYSQVKNINTRSTANNLSDYLQDLTFSTVVEIWNFTLHVNQLTSYIWDGDFLYKLHQYVINSGKPRYKLVIVSEPVDPSENLKAWTVLTKTMNNRELAEEEINNIKKRNYTEWHVVNPQETLQKIHNAFKKENVHGMKVDTHLMEDITFWGPDSFGK